MADVPVPDAAVLPVQPREVTHASNYPKFNGTNFTSWRYGVKMLLEMHRLFSYADGTEVLPITVKSKVLYFSLFAAFGTLCRIAFNLKSQVVVTETQVGLLLLHLSLRTEPIERSYKSN